MGSRRAKGRGRLGSTAARPSGGRDATPPPDPSGGQPLAARLRDDFFRDAGIDPRQFLRAFDGVPGLFYFVKDAQSRTMLSTREYARRMGHRSEDDTVGRRTGEYLAKDLADHYEADDRRAALFGPPRRASASPPRP